MDDFNYIEDGNDTEEDFDEIQKEEKSFKKSGYKDLKPIVEFDKRQITFDDF